MAFTDVYRVDLRHLKDLAEDDRQELVGGTEEHEAVIVLNCLQVVRGVALQLLVLLPDGQLLDIIEVPDGLPANTVEGARHHRCLKGCYNKQSSHPLRVPDSLLKVSFAQVP